MPLNAYKTTYNIPLHFDSAPRTINFDLKLGRKQIGADGKRTDKFFFNYSNAEIMERLPMNKINFADFLPYSVQKRRQ